MGKSKNVTGQCALCRQSKELQLSHIVPHFVVQLSLISQYAGREDFEKRIEISSQGDDFDSIREEYTAMLQNQLSRGNNSLVKKKYLTLTIEADNLKAARVRISRIETDVLNLFNVISAEAKVLNGKERPIPSTGFSTLTWNGSPLNGSGFLSANPGTRAQ